MRIVSLLPAATEICFTLGAGDDVVGVTFECDHPAAARTRPIVSTTTLPPGLTPAEIDAVVRERAAAGEDLYTLDAGALRHLAPDVVITQDLCAVCALDTTDVTEALTYLGCTARVVTTNPQTLPDILTSIEQVAHAIGRDSTPVVADLRERLDQVRANRSGRRVGVVEWVEPLFGAGHWVPEMVAVAGGVNVVGVVGGRSGVVGWEELAGAEVVVVAPCGFGLEAAAEQALGVVERVPVGAEVWAVDANSYFARPGPRVVDGIELLAEILGGGTPDAAKARRVR
ncbi:cobalamin-binding protein [Kribbella sandramycini]|uniref:Cobalamin-binding protein n=1 Tax=Kribbella sandramycini TaxID=60450 RepID=A0A7Y4NWW3_9ACTN|nr:cobalamin-binding protein [Kribbella sandramycini]MBB6568164.1 iron complex transport system substrate-binding protein [Kribbella sandramycini]NOL39242.1 cobalamin-binding protein [Kribbella sandramycini]